MKEPKSRKGLTARNIVVGQRYTNTGHPGAIYLGCGKSTDHDFFGKITNKHLIVISEGICCGRQVHLRKASDFTRAFLKA